MSSTGRREAGSLLRRYQFCAQSYASRVTYCRQSNTDNTEVAEESSCCNTYRHERLQQHMSLGKTNHLPLSDLFPVFDFVETAILWDIFLCCTYIRLGAEFSPYSKKLFFFFFFFLTCHKVAAGQKSFLRRM